MEFETLQQEKQFDHFASEWISRYRHPGREDLAKVMQRAHENLAGNLPSVSAFERAYRELHSEGEVELVTEKLVEPVVAVRQRLTVDEYNSMRASDITRKYISDRTFKADVDDLIKRKLI
jgi:hypothetical protein